MIASRRAMRRRAEKSNSIRKRMGIGWVKLLGQECRMCGGEVVEVLPYGGHEPCVNELIELRKRSTLELTP